MFPRLNGFDHEVSMPHLVRDDTGQLVVVETVGEGVGDDQYAAQPNHRAREFIPVEEQLNLISVMVQLNDGPYDAFDSSQKLAFRNPALTNRLRQRRDRRSIISCVVNGEREAKDAALHLCY